MTTNTDHDKHTLVDDPPPRRPSEPDHEDCCGEGCVPCIWDTYDRAVERHEDRLAAWRERNPGVDVDDGA